MCIIYYNFLKTKFKQNITRQNSEVEIISFTVIAILLLVIFSLTSGWFKYFSVTIGSESMKPNINKGDIIIVKKLNDKEKLSLKEGEVLIFEHANKLVIHRIVKIVELKSGYYFYTKGDNNQAEDGYPIETKDIIGIAYIRIPNLGYPTVWLNELIK